MVKQSQVVRWLENSVANATAYDPDGVYGSQCVDLISACQQKFFNFRRTGNANQYCDGNHPSGSEQFNLGSKSPQPGDILVLKTGPYLLPQYGHINMVLSYDKSSNTVTTADQNVDVGSWGGPTRKRSYKLSQYTGCIIRLPMEMDLPGSYQTKAGVSGGGGGGGGRRGRRSRGGGDDGGGFAGKRFSRADLDAIKIQTDAGRPLYDMHDSDFEYTPTAALSVLGTQIARTGSKQDINNSAFGQGLRIFGMPLHYSPLDDPGRRVFNNTFEGDLPVVFLHPGKPWVNKKIFGTPAEGGWLTLGNSFFNKVGNAGANLVGYLATGKDGFRDNRYMSFKSAMNEYDNYVNTLAYQLHTAMALDGWFDLRDYTNGGKYGLAFYLSKGTSISESANNDYSLSEIGREANDKQAQIREKRMAARVGGTDFISMASNWFGDLMKSVAEIPVIGGIIGSLTQNLDGSMLYYPDKWDNSAFDRSYSLEFRFTSPYGDPESIFYYVYLPFLAIIGLALPLQDGYYSYGQPFIVRASAPGFFETEMGIIRSASFERGSDQMWTAEGLPREITVRMTMTDMYPLMMISEHNNQMKYNYSMVSFIDCMSGIRFDQLGFLDRMKRKIKLGAYRGISLITLRRPRLWAGDKIDNLTRKYYDHATR